MILLDTTILVYASGSDHLLKQPCVALIEAVADGRVAATTTVEVIQEFAHVRVRRFERTRSQTAELANAYTVLLSPLVRPDARDLERGLEIWAQHDALGAFDGVLAASVLNRSHIGTLMSTDRAFGTVAGLRSADPGNPDDLRDIGLD